MLNFIFFFRKIFLNKITIIFIYYYDYLIRNNIITKITLILTNKTIKINKTITTITFNIIIGTNINNIKNYINYTKYTNS